MDFSGINGFADFIPRVFYLLKKVLDKFYDSDIMTDANREEGKSHVLAELSA